VITPQLGYVAMTSIVEDEKGSRGTIPYKLPDPPPECSSWFIIWYEIPRHLIIVMPSENIHQFVELSI